VQIDNIKLEKDKEMAPDRKAPREGTINRKVADMGFDTLMDFIK